MVLLGVAASSLTGCYTQLVVEENNDSYVYQEPIPVIIYYPVPEPVLLPTPPHHPPQRPVEGEYKMRKPESPPPNNDRVRNDIRNSGGRNNDGRNRRR